MKVNVQAFFDPRTFTLTYVVSDPQTKDAVVIDPVLDYEPMGAPEHVARFTLAWIREVRADMLHEESDILSATLLKDDPIVVAMECG